MQGPAMAGPAAAEGTGPVAGPAATDRGLFAGIQTPAQALEVTGCCLHALTDLELHVLQQPGHVGAVGALLDWTNAAWHREVVAAQAVLLATGPAAVAAAVAAAKARRPSPSEPAQLALLLLDKLLLLVTQALSRADADVSVQRALLLEVLAHLQQAFVEAQGAVAVAGLAQAGACRAYLQAWGSNPGPTCSMPAVAGVLFHLMGSL